MVSTPFKITELFYGASTDTKPVTPMVTGGSLLLETDTGRLQLHDGSRWQTLYATRPDVGKSGAWFGNAPTTADGLMGGRMSSIAVGTGTDAQVTDSTGNYRTYDTAATINSLAGHRGSVRSMTRIGNAYFKCKFRTGSSIANLRIFIGFAGSTSDPASSADPGNALNVVAFWYDAGVSANIKRMHNDGSGASTVDDTGTALATSTTYTVEIYAVSDTKFQFVLNNGTPVDISSDIPASTTTLNWRTYIENTTGASRTLDNYYVIIRNNL